MTLAGPRPVGEEVSIDNYRLVMIVGCQRSGTTLLGQILGAHPRAVLIDENNGVYPLVEALLECRPDQSGVLQQCLQAARRNYRDQRVDRSGVPNRHVSHLILKVPNATFQWRRLSAAPWLRAEYVFMIRDARAVVSSMQRLVTIPMVENQLKLIKRSPELVHRFGRELESVSSNQASEVLRSATVWRIKTGLLAEFEPPPLSSLRVRYEDLVAAPVKWIAKVAEHVDLQGGRENMARHHRVLRGFGPGGTRRGRKIDLRSIDVWRRRLPDDAEREVWQATTELMIELGYCRGEVVRAAVPKEGRLS